MRIRQKSRANSLGFQFRKLTLWAIIPFILVTTVSNIVFYLTSKKAFEGQVIIRSEALYETIRIQMDNSIRSYLRSKVETGMDILDAAVSDPDSIAAAVSILQDIRIGETGYYYALDEQGRIVFHPDPTLIGVNVGDQTPGKEQLERRVGYFEYDWQNTYESSLQAKALYMDYMESLDWIITATSYRREFSTMVDLESIQRIINNSRFGESGYSYIFDRQGVIIAHPLSSESEDFSINMDSVEYEEFVRDLFAKEEGFFSYKWRSAPSLRQRDKVVYLKYLPGFDWVIGTAAYRSDVVGPFLLLMILDIAVAVLVGAYLTVSITRFNHSVNRQIDAIATGLAKGRTGDLSVRIPVSGPRELSLITGQVNFFLKSLENKTLQLETLNQILEQRVQERTKELVDAEKRTVTSRLVAGVAHEINNPLGIAITSVSLADERLGALEELYRNEPVPTETAPDLEKENLLVDARLAIDITMRNLRRAGELVRSFKRVSSEQLSLTRQEFLLDEVVNDVLLSLSPLLKKQKIELQSYIPPLKIDSYPGAFFHIITNLVQNSLSHGFNMVPGGKITISAKMIQGLVYLIYEDNGCGIAPEVKDKLFEPFVTTGRSTGSTGLGLHVVNNLVEEKLAGHIEIKSIPGGPTTFTVVFPVDMNIQQEESVDL